MPVDPPIANNDDETPENEEFQPTAPLAPLVAPIQDSAIEESEKATHGDGSPGPTTNPALTPRIDPVTPTDVKLTPRQQRVLHYLARRRMRHARITQRQSHSNKSEVELEDLEPTPQKETIITPKHVTPITPIAPVTPIPASFPQTPIPPANDVSVIPTPQKETSITPDTNSSQVRHYQTPTAPLPPPPTPATRLTGTRNRAIAPVHPPATLTPRQHAVKVRRRRKVLRHLSRKHLRKARATEYRARRNLWLTIGSTILSILIILLSLGTAGSIVAYRFYTQTQTRYEHQVVTLRDLLPLDNLKMYDSKGVLLMQMTDQGLHTTVKLDEIAPVLQNATIATEDRNFWTNQGIDLTGIIRAAIADLSHGGVVEGGSTITQQLIKNLIVGNQSTIIRKLEEVVLTPQINTLYTKRDILEMYLNSIYYGHLAYGIDAAATIYFGLEDKPGKPASMQLDLAQAAMLAGIPSNPSAYDPLFHPETAFARFQNVLSLMVTQRYITKVEALDAIQEAQSPNFFKTAPSLINRAPHFTNFVLDQLVQLFHLKDRSQLSRSGMIVTTTLDINLQDKIQKIAQQHIAELRAAHNLTNAAEVLIDFHTGAILSLLGSIDYNNASIDGQFDVATQSYRQPGSSFKPYVYVTAFEQGASPAQAIDDAPTTIYLPGGDPSTFSPNNYDMSFHGHMTLRCALQNSLNVPAVRVLQHVGIDAAMQTAYDMGITTYQGTPGYSLVLGGLGVRLIDHTSAIGTFANGGVHVPYYAISKVVSGVTNKVLYQHQLDPGKRVISPQLAYMMTNVLSDNTSRIPEFFDCNVLQLYSNSQSDCWNGNRGVVRPAAAKTGTTQNFRDNWTVGYTTDYVMGVWAGNDNNTPMIDVTGVQGAAPIWHDSMLVAEQGHPIRNFVNPGGLQRATVTYPDGVTTTDWFLPGTVPTFDTTISTPTASSTSPTDSTPTPGTPTPTPGGNPSPVTAHPYCPNDYSFAFNPPASTTPANGWW